MIEKRDFYINGKWVAPAAANDCNVIDPFDRRGLRGHFAW